MIMLRTAIIAASIVMLTSSAMAQSVTDSHLAAANRALTALQATDRFDNILPTIAERIRAQLIANNPDVELEILTTVEEVALSMVGRRGDLEREAAAAYANGFSEDDLNAIADFYESDPGKALLASGAIVTRELAQLSSVWSRGIQRDMLEAVSVSLNAQNLRDGGVDLTGAAESAAEGGTGTTE